MKWWMFYNSTFAFITNEYDDVQVLEGERMVGWDVMNNHRGEKIAWFKVLSVFIDSFQ